jgi:hypothetical protein
MSENQIVVCELKDERYGLDISRVFEMRAQLRPLEPALELRAEGMASIGFGAVRS